MKTYFTMAVLCLMASPAFSQILFEEGYYIENSGNRVDCLIRNVDWKNNPGKVLSNIMADGASELLPLEGQPAAVG